MLRFRLSTWSKTLAVALLLALAAGGATRAVAGAAKHDEEERFYAQTNLVSDQPGVALHTDANLVNAWGISHSPTSPFWVSDNGMGVSTLYNGSGTPPPPQFTDLFMLLLQMGIAPDVDFVRYPVINRYKDMDEALLDSRMLFGSGWDEARARTLLEEMSTREGDEIVIDSGVALSGIAHWQPRLS